MADINITVASPSVVEIEQDGVRLKMIARRTMDGNIIVLDHNLIDIIINVADKKVIAYPKHNLTDLVYAAQERLFEYLAKNGVIKHDSILGGEVYSSLQAEYGDAADGANTTQLVLFNVGKWINEERPHMEQAEYLQKKGIERLTTPSDEESTDFGEVPHKAKQGSIDPQRIRRYLSGYGLYEQKK